MIGRAMIFAAQMTILAAVSNPVSAAILSEPNYTARCQMCHQRNGEGVAGQFPRLSGRVDKIAGTDQGRRYLILVVLHGIVGGITVEGRGITGFMPPMGVLKDDQIASILNALSATGAKKPRLFTASEVAKVRAEGRMSASQTAAERAKLVSAGLLP
ncbi:MAG TPA: cytochrome c [Sphingobium sp.]